MTALCFSFFFVCAATSACQELSKAAEFARENQQAIKAKFANFQTDVCDKLIKNEIDTEKFRLFVMNQFPPGDCIPPSPASLTEIFKAITRHGLWDYFNYSPLIKIGRKFGAHDAEMEDWVQTYKKDLKAFSLMIKLKDYIEADLDVDNLDVDDLPPAKRAKYDPCYNCSVQWKTNISVDHSLQYLSEVWEGFSCRYLMPDSPPTALLHRVCRGCLSVTWLVPKGLMSTLLKTATIDTDFFKRHCILRVMVEKKCVYEESTSVSFLWRDM